MRRKHKDAVVIQETFLDLVGLIRAHLKGPKDGSSNWTTELVVLMTIWEGGPVTASHMARRSGIARSTCMRVANVLMRRRIVRKDRSSRYLADARHLKKLDDAAFFRDIRKLIISAAKRL
jgi:hypothetical protein